MAIEKPNVEELFGFLTDKCCLEPQHAFNIIYYLQEDMHLIPDSWELCANCKRIFDSYSEGFYFGDDENYGMHGWVINPEFLNTHICGNCEYFVMNEYEPADQQLFEYQLMRSEKFYVGFEFKTISFEYIYGEWQHWCFNEERYINTEEEVSLPIVDLTFEEAMEIIKNDNL